MAESKPKGPGDRTAFGWYLALKFADEALRFSKDAESMSRNESIPRADIRTEQTFSDIKHRYSLSKIRFLFELTLFSLAKVPIARECMRTLVPLCRFIFFRTTTVQCNGVAWQTVMIYD